MREFLAQDFYGNSIQSWAISLGIFVGAIIVAKILYWFIGKYVKRITERTKTNLDDLLIDKLEEPVVYGIAIIGFYWGFHRLSFGEDVDHFFDHVFTIIFTLNITWLLVRVVDSLIEEYIVPVVSKTESDLDDQLLPLLRKLLKAILWAMGIIIGLNNAGFDVMALIAGLGIGGLALALAAQDTVKNIFGGVMILLDKPFKISDRIKMDGFDGIVEEVGIRSTRVRTLEGRLVTIPNMHFSETAVENVSMEPTRKVVLNLGLTYDTTPEGMQKAMDILKQIILDQTGVQDECLVSFNTWGDSSMGILFIYYITDMDNLLQVQTDVNMAILKQFNESGLEFAFPSRTVYNK